MQKQDPMESNFWCGTRDNGGCLDENNKLGLGSACHHAQMSVARWNVLHSARAGLTTMEHWYGLPEALFR